MASLEKAFTDLADFFSVVFINVRTRFIWKKTSGKFNGRVGNLEVKNTAMAPSVQQENKQNNFVYCKVAIGYD